MTKRYSSLRAEDSASPNKKQDEAVLEAERLHKLATAGMWHAVVHVGPATRIIAGDSRKISEAPTITAWDGVPLVANRKAITSLHNIAPVLFSAYHREKGLAGLVRQALKELEAGQSSDAEQTLRAALTEERGE